MHTKHHSEKENLSEICNSLETLKTFKSRQPSTSLTSIMSFTSLQHNKLISKSKINELQKLTSQTFHSNTARYPQPKPTAIPKNEAKSLRNPTKTLSPLSRKYKTTTNDSILNDTTCLPPESEISRLINGYSNEMLGYLSVKQKVPIAFLKSHSISATLRAKMIDWMVEVLTSYKCRDQTFFLAVQLMDQFLLKTERVHQPSELHLLGVAAMFIACKYEEIYPVKLQVVHEKIAHKKLSKDDIKNKEAEILNTLQFEIVYVTIYEILTHLHVRIAQAFKMSKRVEQYVLRTIVHIAKMVLYDYDLISTLSEGLMILSGGILAVGIKIAERVDPTIQVEEMTQLITQITRAEQEQLMTMGNRILNTVKTFEKMFPTLENLKKFNKYSFDDF